VETVLRAEQGREFHTRRGGEQVGGVVQLRIDGRGMAH
jgi:hypothetical protein